MFEPQKTLLKMESAVRSSAGQQRIDRIYRDAKITQSNNITTQLAKIAALHFELGRLKGLTEREQQFSKVA